MGETWIDFVKRIQAEGKKKDKDYSFKQAMIDAGDRKSEWKKDGSSSASSNVNCASNNKKSRKSKKGGKKRKSSTKKRSRSRK